MATDTIDRLKELWVAWTHDAMKKYVPPEDVTSEELVDDMIDVSTDYASGMLDAYEATFPDGGRGRREERRSDGRSRRRKEGPSGGGAED